MPTNNPITDSDSNGPAKLGYETFGRRTFAVMLAAVLLIGSVSITPGIALGSSAFITIQEVTVTPSDPAPGELVTFHVTLQNSQASHRPVELSGLWLRTDSDTFKEHVNNPGTVAPGESLTVPITTSFDKPGIKHIRIDPAGASIDVEYPLTLVVSDVTPRINTRADDLVTGAENDVTVTVTNPRTSPIRDVRVRLAGENLSVAENSRYVSTIPAGETHRLTYEVTSNRSGKNLATFRLDYRNPLGQLQTIEDKRTLFFDSPGSDTLSITTVTRESEAIAPGDPLSVSFTLTNNGEAPLHGLNLSLDVSETPLESADAGPTVYLNELAGNSERTVTFHLRAAPDSRSGLVAVPLSYRYVTSDGTQINEKTSISVAILGDPELRAFVREISTGDSGTTLTIDVANVGSGPAKSAYISVNDTSGSSYYLGDIGPGSYESAELEVPASTASAHVQIYYSNAFNDPASSEQTLKLPTREGGIPVVGIALGVVGILLIGIWGWRRWRR